VWTELKVLFLLYDLKTRAGIKNLATCSALTAGGTPTYQLHLLWGVVTHEIYA